VFLTLSILSASASQVIIKALLVSLPRGLTTQHMLQTVLSGDYLRNAALAGSLLVVGFLFWLLSLHQLPLSYAYSLACSSALVVAFLSAAFLGEAVTWRIWVGATLIMLGSVFVVYQD